MLHNHKDATIVAIIFIIFTKTLAKDKIVVNYDFYNPDPEKDLPFCMPRIRWESPTVFSFNDTSPLPNLIVKNESVLVGQYLRISCTSSQPLQWILGLPEVAGKFSNYYLEPEDAQDAPENRYHACITFKNLKSLSGTVRCECILNETLGAEIFIENEGMKPLLADCTTDIPKEFIVVGNENIVPCKMLGGGTGNKNSLDVDLVINTESELGSKNTSDIATPQVFTNAKRNYDPWIGFHLNKTIAPKSKFTCDHDSTDCRFVAISDDGKNMDVNIEYTDENYKTASTVELLCSVENTKVDTISRLDFSMAPCGQLLGCAHRNTAPSIYLPYVTTATAPTKHDGMEMKKSNSNRTWRVIFSPPPSGLAYCRGKLEKSGRYFGKYDYFFKGIDERGLGSRGWHPA